MIANVGKVGFFGRGEDFLDEHGIESKNYAEDVHGFNVRITHVSAHCGDGLIQDHQATMMWWASERIQDDEGICFGS